MSIDCAGIDWLMGKFKAYVILRDRLLTDTSILRDKLDVAVPDFANGKSSLLSVQSPVYFSPLSGRSEEVCHAPSPGWHAFINNNNTIVKIIMLCSTLYTHGQP